MTDSNRNDPVDELVRQIKATRKYGDICDETIRDVVEQALPKYKRRRDAAKVARTKLHRIQAAYLGRNVIAERLDDVRGAHEAGDASRLRAVCLQLMQDHASTRERIGLLDRFYRDVFAVTGTPRTILDVACGVHPLSIPWMELPADAVYHAYEISAKMVASLNGFLTAIGVTGSARLQDVICTPPQETGDLAFLMKMVPCLERRQKGIAVKLIENLKVDYVVVSFPVHSLAGRSKHMPEFYTQTFIDMVDEYPWQVTHVPIEGELVFVVDKRAG